MTLLILDNGTSKFLQWKHTWMMANEIANKIRKRLLKIFNLQMKPKTKTIPNAIDQAANECDYL